MKNKLFLILSIFILAFLLTGCSLNFRKPKTITPETKPPVAQIGEVEIFSLEAPNGSLQKFTDYNDLQTFLSSWKINQGAAMNYLRGDMVMMDDMVFSEAAPAMKQQLEGGSSDFSTTNIQVAGVDEADLIKTDGNYIYALVYNDLYIIKAFPPEELKIESKISFRSRPSDIFIDGDRLAVMGSDEQIIATDIYRSFKRQTPYTFFKIFDISDKNNPKTLRDLNFEGTYFQSRLIDGQVYLLLNNYSNYIEGEPLIPRLVDGGRLLPNTCTGDNPCFAPEVFYFDIDYDQLMFSSLNIINLQDQTIPVDSQIYLLNGAQNLYVSKEAIYISGTQYLSEYDLILESKFAVLSPLLAPAEQEKIVAIEQAPAFLLTNHEKKLKIDQVLEAFVNQQSSDERYRLEQLLEERLKTKYQEVADRWQTTLIHKIAITKEGSQHQASGEIPGRVLNQFSFDEYNGHLRVATTLDRRFSRFQESQESSSGVYILDNQLQLVGSVSNLAPGERIYSVRFLGPRGYLVTFKEIDPLFALDLSDPKSPQVLGELKIPGFSTYLHPYDDNKLIGLGRDTTLDPYGNVRLGGLKLSLFDVQDINNPRELDAYIFGGAGSQSIALDDHRAFLFSLSKNLLVIPTALRSDFYQSLDFSGAIVFSIINDRFEERGRVDHSDGGLYGRSDSWRGLSYFDNTVKRSLYIGNYLYTLSNKFLRINSLVPADNLSEVSGLKFVPDSAADLEWKNIIDSQTPPVEEPIVEPLIPESVVNPIIGPALPVEPEPVPVIETGEQVDSENLDSSPLTEETNLDDNDSSLNNSEGGDNNLEN